MALDLKLPPAIIGSSELARVSRDLDTFNEELQQAKLRSKSAGKVVEQDPQPTKLLQALAAANECDVADATQRSELQTQLQQLLKAAPTVTLSFAAEPSLAFMGKLVDWFRTSIDPHLLVRVGLQPSITAGFILRTPAKVYDFSLESKFTEQRPLLIDRIRQPEPALTPTKAPAAAAEAKV